MIIGQINFKKIMKEEDENFVLKECVCKNCPSYLDCKETIGYCVLNKSKCIKKRDGCICGGCSVYRKLNLEGYYFCLEK